MIALVVGHKSTSTGAANRSSNLSEFEFNARLAIDVWRVLTIDEAIETSIVWRRTWAGLPEAVNILKPDFAVSMHANASHEHSASGTEVLYYHHSETSAKVATIFQDCFLSVLSLRDRGIKATTSEDRGGSLLKNVDAPIVLCEPFFIDNDDDLKKAIASDLAGAYVEAIKEAMDVI